MKRPLHLHGGGFSLVEMLVALGVLSLLVVILGQVVALTEQAIAFNLKSLDAASQARMVFDRLGADLASRPNRTDLPITITKNTGNDTFQFYSEIDGYNGTRHVSEIGYRIQESTPNRIFQLERGAIGTDWTSSGNLVVQFDSSPEPFPPAANDDPNYDVLASGIFRLEFCYRLNTGAISNGPPPSDWNNVVAIVVGVALLDSKSRLLLSSEPTSQMSALSKLLQDPAEGSDPLSTWTANLETANYSAANIPTEVTKNIRLYQRTFCVP